MNIKDLINNSQISNDEKEKMLEELKMLEKLNEVTTLARNLAISLVNTFRDHITKLQEMPNGISIYTQQILSTISAASFCSMNINDPD